MSGYVPRADSEFNVWMDKLMDYLIPNLERFKLTPEEVATLQALKPEWDSRYQEHQRARALAIGARAEKDNCRAQLESEIRRIVMQVQACGNTDDGDRAALGITIRGSGTGGSTGELADERPVAFIDISQRMKHVLRVENSTDMGASKAKPSRAFGCEVWRRVGGLPGSDGSDMQYVGMMTRNPFTVTYSAEDAGKTVHYMLRWVDRKGKPGNWSGTRSATIAA